MQISRATDRTHQAANSDWFTGEVTMAPLARPDGPSLVAALEVIRPGARTNWHTHPVGQTLIVTQGRGWARAGARPGSISVPATWCASHRANAIGTAPPTTAR